MSIVHRPPVGGHLLGLDGLRGIAAIGVVLLHLRPNHIFWMWSMVDLFFVISGLVITRLLFQIPAFSPRVLWHFWMRRTLRIWPVYYLAMMLSVGIASLLLFLGWSDTPPFNAGAWRYLLFVQLTELYDRSLTLKDIGFILFFFPSWSLAVEEQFYLLWPLLIFVLRKRPLAIAVVCVLVILSAIWARSAGFNPMLLLTRMDGLAMGALIAVFLHIGHDTRTLRVPHSVLIASVFLGVALASPYLIEGYTSGREYRELFLTYPLAWVVFGFNLSFASLILLALHSPTGVLTRFLEVRGLVYLGGLSFAIYMFHQPILGLYKAAFAQLEWGRTRFWDMAYLGLVIGISHVSYRAIEMPIQSLKSRFPLKSEARPLELNANPAVSATTQK